MKSAMTGKSSVLKLALVAAVVAFGSTTARAGSISYEDMFSYTETNFFTQSLSFPQYNGTGLTSVTLTFLPEGTGADSGTYTAMETAGSLTNGAEEAFADFGVSVTFLVGSSPFSGINFAIDSPTIYDGALTPGQVVTWTDGQTFTELTPTADSTQTITCPDCSAFIGSGTYVISDIEAFGGYFGNFPTNYTQSATTYGEAVAEITYNYTALTPEPGTEYLIGVGLVGFSLLVARRRASKSRAGKNS